MKMTFKCKVVADTSHPIINDKEYEEPTYEHLRQLLAKDVCYVELVMPWSADSEPTLIITEHK